MRKSLKTKAKTPKEEKTVKQNAATRWAQSAECHKLMAEWWRFAPWEGVTKRDLMGFAFHGNLVSQAYLYSLRKAIPFSEDKGRLWQNPFEKHLLSHARLLNAMLCELAKEGRSEPCHELWNQALKLTETFSELALKNPTLFKTKARQSLFMPSIRSKNPEFTADAKAIGDAIELSADTVGSNLKDNRKRLGALTAKLIAECVEEIMRSRRLWSDFFIPYELPVIWPTKEQVNPFLSFLGKDPNDFLDEMKTPPLETENTEEKMVLDLQFFCLLAGCGVERIHFLTLPELTATTAPDWWKGAIEKMVEAKFSTLLQQPNWEKELNAVSTGTDKDKLHELKKYCVGKVKQFAPRIPRP